MENQKLVDKKTELSIIEDALRKALVPLKPRDELFSKLQSHVKDLSQPSRKESTTKPKVLRQNGTYFGLAGVLVILVTVVVGFRTAGSIIGAIALMNEMNKRVKTKKISPLTPAG